jgi:glycosyltransferase involved in cell wall biosynthesis
MDPFRAIFKEKKVCVLVPTYNNEQTLERVLTGILGYTDQVIVVNDGSTDSTGKILEQFRTLEVISYAANQGKGYALLQGFRKAVSSGYQYAISMDSDGQHFADDLPVFLTALDHYPGSIIIGKRNMDQVGIPGKSNFGRNFSNFWFRFETGLRLDDTQSGFRLYPIQRLQNTTFITRKFEFEIEVLVRAAWAGIPVCEVPVKVFYPAKEMRISHFRPVRDFTRISILNTALVAITLLYILPRNFIRSFSGGKGFWRNVSDMLFKTAESDFTKAASVGFGVFMSIFPIWGLQLIVAIGLAFLLKLNKSLVIISANLSIPPMIPPILFLSHITGAFWMGDRAVLISFDETLSIKLLKDSFVQYLVGAVTLSIGCGIIFGLITYALLKLFRGKYQT